jgi:hypothetical protein
MKTLMTATAVAALLAAGPVLAQDANAPASPPAAGDTATPAKPAIKPVAPQPDATAPATPSPEAAAPAAPATTQTAEAPKPAEKFLGQQEEGEMLASNWIGQTVYSPSDENLGTINDIVFNKDGGVDAVVIGVGGFLGIGQKNIAVSIDAVNESTDKDGNMKLTLDTTKEELDAAPQFVSLLDLKKQQAQPPAEPAAPAAPGATTEPAPAEPMQPAPAQ